MERINGIIKNKKFSGQNPHLNSGRHLLIQEMRKHFDETNKRGAGSFGHYLGGLRGISDSMIYKIFADAKESGRMNNGRNLFWYMIKEYKKLNKS